MNQTDAFQRTALNGKSVQIQRYSHFPNLKYEMPSTIWKRLIFFFDFPIVNWIQNERWKQKTSFKYSSELLSIC